MSNLVRKLTQSSKQEVATPVQVKPSLSFVLRYSTSSVFCPNSGSNRTTALSWLLAENSDGMKRLTPARMEASTNLFCSPSPVAPTAEMTASWPLKAAIRLLSERSVLTTVTPDGKVALLSLREMTVILNLEDSARPSRMILPMLPLA